MLTTLPVKCTKCGTEQYFGRLQPFGMLNRSWTRMMCYQSAIRHLWWTQRYLEDGLCPKCVVTERPRAVPKIKVAKDIKEITQSGYSYGFYYPLMTMLWRKRGLVTFMELFDKTTLRLTIGRLKYEIRKDELIDPMMFDLFVQKHKRPDYATWMTRLLEDQLDYVQHMMARPDLMEKGKTINVFIPKGDVE